MFKQSVVLLSGLLSASAFAQWTLDQDNSALHFMSTKNPIFKTVFISCVFIYFL